MMRAWTVLYIVTFKFLGRVNGLRCLRSQPGGWKCRSTKGTLQAWGRSMGLETQDARKQSHLPKEGPHVRVHHLQEVTRREASAHQHPSTCVSYPP